MVRKVPKKTEKYEVRQGQSKYVRAFGATLDDFADACNMVDAGVYPVWDKEKALVMKITTEVVYDPNNLTGEKDGTTREERS